MKSIDIDMETRKRYPVGIPSFEIIRKEDYYYVDKTDIMHRLVNDYRYVFLSRPRRFGKSLLLSTLDAYFMGKRELFEGLKIEQFEHDWTAYPVLRFDMSISMGKDLAILRSSINNQLAKYESEYGVEVLDAETATNYGVRLGNIILGATKKTGQLAVVLIDEYDAPIQEQLIDTEMLETVRGILLNFYLAIKQNAGSLRFAFLTGITKFAQMSIFSKLNNITDISMDQRYETICGVTQDELETCFSDGIDQLAKANGETREGVIAHIKEMYDGYHFTRSITDIYNPYSLVQVLSLLEYRNYWFSSGTPTMLIRMMQKFGMSYLNLEETLSVGIEVFETPMEKLNDVTPLLYQSGYLTIKGYDPESESYLLGIPNREVRLGLARSLYNYYKPQGILSRSTMLNAYYAFKRDGDVDAFMEAVRRFYLTIPYDLDNCNERHYQALFYAAMKSFGGPIEAEKRTANGRIDIVMYMPDKIYILEFKYQKTADDALNQVIKKDYKAMFADDPRPVVEIGMNVSADLRTIDSWEYVNGQG